MVHITQEVHDTSHSILIICKKESSFIERLYEYAKKHGSKVITSPSIPPRIDHFQSVIVIDEYTILRKLLRTRLHTPIVYITKYKELAQYAQEHFDIRVAYLTSFEINKNQLEQLIWFIFVGKQSNYLELTAIKSNSSPKIQRQSSHELPRISAVKVVGCILLCIGSYIILMIGLLIFALSNHAALMTQSSCILLSTSSCMSAADNANTMSQLLYKPIRPILFMFSLGLPADSLFRLDTELTSLTHLMKTTSGSSGTILQHMLLGDARTKHELENFKNQTALLTSSLQTTHALVPSYMPYAQEVKNTIEDTAYTMIKINALAPSLPSFFDRSYTLLLVNNDDSTAGGGVITHIGQLSFTNYKINPLSFTNVARIASSSASATDIPAYTKKLSQSPWDPTHLLTSADMDDNYKTLKLYLAHVPAVKNSQSIVIATYESIKALLTAAGTVSIVPYGPLTAENFSVKAVLYKNDEVFMSRVFDALIQRAKSSTLQSSRFTTILPDLFSSKQLAILTSDTKIQEKLDAIYWSGKVRRPDCAVNQDQCIGDYIQVIDTNRTTHLTYPQKLQKSLRHEVQIDKNNNVHVTSYIRLKSPTTELDKTQWYEQIILPQEATIDSLLLDGHPTTYDLQKSTFTSVGLTMDLPKGKIKQLALSYHLPPPQNNTSKNSTYQLLIQKQFGSQDTDVSVSISLSSQLRPIQYNFTPVVNQNNLFYNTKLDSDRLFILTLSET